MINVCTLSGVNYNYNTMIKDDVQTYDVANLLYNYFGDSFICVKSKNPEFWYLFKNLVLTALFVIPISVWWILFLLIAPASYRNQTEQNEE